jgi:phage gp16-like protein
MIAAISIGKKNLKLDDDIYRPMLKRLTGKESLKLMTEHQLSLVLDHFKKALGFVPAPPKANTKSNAKPKPRSPAANKIRAIWITMHKQGFLENGSDRALDAYCQRMTKTKNGQGVQYLVWLDNWQAQSVLESLKRWHFRLMKEHLQKCHADVPPITSYEVLSTYYANTKF